MLPPTPSACDIDFSDAGDGLSAKFEEPSKEFEINTLLAAFGGSPCLSCSLGHWPLETSLARTKSNRCAIVRFRTRLVGSFLERVGRGRVGHSVARMILQMWRQSDYD